MFVFHDEDAGTHIVCSALALLLMQWKTYDRSRARSGTDLETAPQLAHQHVDQFQSECCCILRVETRRESWAGITHLERSPSIVHRFAATGMKTSRSVAEPYSQQ